ncbi:MAG: archaeal heat shock protein Hsp20 [Promethearchaeota archaeon]
MTPKKRKEDENDKDEDDEDEDPYDLFKKFGNPEDLFKNFDLGKFFNAEQFQQIFKQVFKQIMKDLPKNLQDMTPEEITREIWKNRHKYIKSPIMYGFNITSGPDGKPVIDSFGTLKPETYTGKTKVKKEREPLVEVSQDANQIIVVAEMPGVTRDDIELKATTRSLTISTRPESNRKYFKEVKLPTAINSDYAKARYVNGILEIKLKKIDERETDIKISD